MERKNNAIVVILIVIAFLLVLSGVYLIYHSTILTQKGGPTTGQATSTNTYLGQTYSSTQSNYSIQYPANLALAENIDYPAAPGNNIKATVFSFPAQDLASTTISQANISVAVTSGVKGDCSLWADGTQKFPAQSTQTINGVQFTLRQVDDAAAGNIYSSSEYSAPVGNKCYRVTLFTHRGNPGMYSGDQSTIDALTLRNQAAQQVFVDVFGQMLATFKLQSDTTASTTSSNATSTAAVIVVTQNDLNKTVNLHIGDLLQFQLGNYKWNIQFSDPSFVSLVNGQYKAVKAGTVTVHASGGPICNANQPCPMFLIAFTTTLVISQ